MERHKFNSIKINFSHKSKAFSKSLKCRENFYFFSGVWGGRREREGESNVEKDEDKKLPKISKLVPFSFVLDEIE